MLARQGMQRLHSAKAELRQLRAFVTPALAALALLALPAMSFATCFGKEHQAQSCVAGTAWDVAWATVFLASDEARWISGITLPVDAGLLAATPLAMFPHLKDPE